MKLHGRSDAPGVGRDPARWRLRPWPGDRATAQLVLTDHNHVVRADDVQAGLDLARRRGYRTVRTSALFPVAAEMVAEMGFTAADRLALLRLDGIDRREFPTPSLRTRPMRTWQYRAAAAVDRAAFGHPWGNDAAGLREITRATPRHHSRVHGSVDGFAISGAAGPTGYLQRLAVAPSARRRGIARALVADALAWMQRSRLAAALVNTGVANDPALALYEQFGFVRLGHDLTVAEFNFDG